MYTLDLDLVPRIKVGIRGDKRVYHVVVLYTTTEKRKCFQLNYNTLSIIAIF